MHLRMIFSLLEGTSMLEWAKTAMKLALWLLENMGSMTSQMLTESGLEISVKLHICISPLHAFHIPRRGSGLGFIRQVLRLIWIIYCAHASGTTLRATAEATTQLIWTRIMG